MEQEYELHRKSCDLIEELIEMLWTKNLTDEEKVRLNEIEDFAVNQLGED